MSIRLLLSALRKCERDYGLLYLEELREECSRKKCESLQKIRKRLADKLEAAILRRFEAIERDLDATRAELSSCPSRKEADAIYEQGLDKGYEEGFQNGRNSVERCDL